MRELPSFKSGFAVIWVTLALLPSAFAWQYGGSIQSALLFLIFLLYGYLVFSTTGIGGAMHSPDRIAPWLLLFASSFFAVASILHDFPVEPIPEVAPHKNLSAADFTVEGLTRFSTPRRIRKLLGEPPETKTKWREMPTHMLGLSDTLARLELIEKARSSKGHSITIHDRKAYRNLLRSIPTLAASEMNKPLFPDGYRSQRKFISRRDWGLALMEGRALKVVVTDRPFNAEQFPKIAAKLPKFKPRENVILVTTKPTRLRASLLRTGAELEAWDQKPYEIWNYPEQGIQLQFRGLAEESGLERIQGLRLFNDAAVWLTAGDAAKRVEILRKPGLRAEADSKGRIKYFELR